MNILITGGTGSLGTALVEQLLHMPSFERICIYSRDEHKQERMRGTFKNNSKLRFFIGDVRDKDRLTLACKNIQMIVHAAAMKVVPTAEYNPFEALKTNVIGAQNVIEAAIANSPANALCGAGTWPKVLAISSDKAVHPINLYGATKLCAEKLFIDANNIMGHHGPRFSVARYGNVANSNGSVIPLFKSQSERGENLTITHDQMTRFWITLDEAVKLVMYSLNTMHGREIFIPHMPSFKIQELALGMMESYPLEQQWCKVTGVRPGEKLHESIITKEEQQSCWSYPEHKIVIIRPGLYNPESVYIDEPLTSNSMSVQRLTQTQLMQRVNSL